MLTGWGGGNLRRLPRGGWNAGWTGAAERGVKGASGWGHSLGRGVAERMYQAGGGDAPPSSSPLCAFLHVTSSSCLPRWHVAPTADWALEAPRWEPPPQDHTAQLEGWLARSSNILGQCQGLGLHQECPRQWAAAGQASVSPSMLEAQNPE